MGLRAAVVGAGNMGRHHMRILGGMHEVDLVQVVDPDTARAAEVVGTRDVAVVATLAELADVDIAVVASPTPAHVEQALALIERGIDVLVEKPLAGDPESALEIVRAARERGVVLAVGHVERFNPAAHALKRMAREPRLLQFERMSPYTPRIGDSVVFDLMVHDLDLACWIVGENPSRVQASGAKVFSDSIDVAIAVLEFPSGAIASLVASRATQDKVRRITMSEAERFFIADCMRGDVSVKRETTVEFSDDTENVYRQASVVEIPYLDRGEPLAAELADFVDAVTSGREPRVPGEAGATAVALAYQVEAAASRS